MKAPRIKSRGHIGYAYGFEFYEDEDGHLHRAPVTNAIGSDGYRYGKWECGPQSDNHVHYLKQTWGLG